MRDDLPSGLWHDMGRACITRWVDDAARCCHRIDQALRVTDERNDDSVAAVEEALWRLDAAREKLEAVFSLAFGVPALEPYKRGVAFRPNTGLVRSKLETMAGQHETALAHQADRALGASASEHPSS